MNLNLNLNEKEIEFWSEYKKSENYNGDNGFIYSEIPGNPDIANELLS